MPSAAPFTGVDAAPAAGLAIGPDGSGPRIPRAPRTSRWLPLAELTVAATPGLVLAFLGARGEVMPMAQVVIALTAVAVILVAWAVLRRESRLRSVLRRLLQASDAHVGDGMLTGRPDVLYALEVVARTQAEEMHALRSGLRRLREEEDGIRRVLQQLAPAAYRYVLDGVDIAGVSAARGRCGGDWYVVRKLADGRVLVAVGDVAGHDPASAYVAAAISGALRVIASRMLLNDPERVLGRLTRLVEELSSGTLTSTCVLAVLDLHGRQVRFVNAGHPAPWILRDGVVVETLAPSGGPLGLARGAAVTHAARVTRLELGDRLIFFSDGVIEQPDPAGRVFGLRRLRDTTRSAVQHAPRSRELLAQIMKDFRAFSGDTRLSDDVSVVVCSLVAEVPALASISDEETPTEVSNVPYPGPSFERSAPVRLTRT